VSEDDKKRITVTIFGQSYKMVGKASTNYMRMVAGMVDEKMKNISEQNPRLDTTRIAVLTAVNIADEYIRLKQEFDELVKLLEEEEEG